MAEKSFGFKRLSSVTPEEASLATRDTAAKWKYKFTVVLSGDCYDFFAETKLERMLWIIAFARVIDANFGVKPEDSAHQSICFLNLVKAQNGRQQQFYDPSSKASKPILEMKKGALHYYSQTMTVNNETCRGFVMKMITNMQWYHRQNYHKKFIDV